MQIPNRGTGAYGYPVRNYTPVPLYPQYPGSQCASTKATSGKSFTIDALLAKPEDTGSDRMTLAHRGVKFQQATPLIPFPGQIGLPIPATYIYSPNVIHQAVQQPGYSIYCCPPYNFQSSCRGVFYGQDLASKGNLHSFKNKGGKSKRMRTSFTNDQLSRLEKEFARQQYMVGSERFLLASALQLTEAQVKVWFQNRRIKWRKQSLEQQQAKLAKLGLAAPPKSPGSQGNGGEGEEDEEFSGTSDVDVDVDVSDGSVCHC